MDEWSEVRLKVVHATGGCNMPNAPSWWSGLVGRLSRLMAALRTRDKRAQPLAAPQEAAVRPCRPAKVAQGCRAQGRRAAPNLAAPSSP